MTNPATLLPWYSCRRWRYDLIRALAGDMPIVMNMAIIRPLGFKGELFRFDASRAGMFTGNVQLPSIYSRGMPLLHPVRDFNKKESNGA